MNILEDSNDSTHVNSKIYQIREDAELYKHIMNGNYVEKGSSFENPVPTIIRNKNSRLCIFTYSDQDNPYPTVYIYELAKRRNVAKASKASIFLHF